MPTTPVFGWPYLGLLDPPNLAKLGEELALAIEATVASASSRMGCTLSRTTTAQPMTSGVDTTVVWDTEDQDTHGLFSSGSTITIPAGGTGIWAITFGINLSGPVAGRSLMFIQPSAGTWSTAGGGLGRLRNSFPANEEMCSVSGVLPMSAGDTFDCRLNVAVTGSFGARLTAYRVAT